MGRTFYAMMAISALDWCILGAALFFLDGPNSNGMQVLGAWLLFNLPPIGLVFAMPALWPFFALYDYIKWGKRAMRKGGE